MLKLFDFQCQNPLCLCLFESLEESSQATPSCPCCLTPSSWHPSPLTAIAPSPERTKSLLRKRSKAHMDACLKTGNHPDSVSEQSSCSEPIWKNKTRAKVYDSERRQKLAHLSKPDSV